MESAVLLQDLKDTGHPSVGSQILIMCVHHDSCHFMTSSPPHWDLFANCSVMISPAGASPHQPQHI